jgi:glutathione S-transferase
MLKGGFPLIENKSVHIAEAKPWLPFGQFPYLTHGPVRMAQSGAIMRYVASKAGLDGREDDVDFATCQMLLEEHQDLYTLYAGAMYAPEGRAAGFRALFEPGSALHKQLRYLERILDGKEHFCSKILAGDCKFWFIY